MINGLCYSITIVERIYLWTSPRWRNFKQIFSYLWCANRILYFKRLSENNLYRVKTNRREKKKSSCDTNVKTFYAMHFKQVWWSSVILVIWLYNSICDRDVKYVHNRRGKRIATEKAELSITSIAPSTYNTCDR